MPNEGRKRKKVHVHCDYNLLLYSLCLCLPPPLSLSHTHTFCRLLNDEDILFINLLNLSSSCSSTTVVGVIISPYFFLITSSLNISGNLAYKEIVIIHLLHVHVLIKTTCTCIYMYNLPFDSQYTCSKTFCLPIKNLPILINKNYLQFTKLFPKLPGIQYYNTCTYLNITCYSTNEFISTDTSATVCCLRLQFYQL